MQLQNYFYLARGPTLDRIISYRNIRDSEVGCPVGRGHIKIMISRHSNRSNAILLQNQRNNFILRQSIVKVISSFFKWPFWLQTKCTQIAVNWSIQRKHFYQMRSSQVNDHSKSAFAIRSSVLICEPYDHWKCTFTTSWIAIAKSGTKLCNPVLSSRVEQYAQVIVRSIQSHSPIEEATIWMYEQTVPSQPNVQMDH